MASRGDTQSLKILQFSDSPVNVVDEGNFSLSSNAGSLYFNGAMINTGSNSMATLSTQLIVPFQSGPSVTIGSNLILRQMSDSNYTTGQGFQYLQDGRLFFEGVEFGARTNLIPVLTTNNVTAYLADEVRFSTNLNVLDNFKVNTANITFTKNTVYTGANPQINFSSGSLNIQPLQTAGVVKIFGGANQANVWLVSTDSSNTHGTDVANFSFVSTGDSASTTNKHAISKISVKQSESLGASGGGGILTLSTRDPTKAANTDKGDSDIQVNMLTCNTSTTGNVISLGPGGDTDNVYVGIGTQYPTSKLQVYSQAKTFFSVDTVNSKVFLGTDVALDFAGPITISGQSADRIQIGTTGAGSQSTSLGISASASGSQAVALGYQAGGASDNTVAVGFRAGQTAQSANAVAIGHNSGQSTQGSSSIAIGEGAGQSTQGSLSVAIGEFAGQIGQNAQTLSIGFNAGQLGQQTGSVALGYQTGQSVQASMAVALGYQAGKTLQSANAIAIGSLSGATSQGSWAVAIGGLSGTLNQGAGAIALGESAGQLGQNTFAISVGQEAGRSGQYAFSIAIGRQAAQLAQNAYSIAVGYQAGQTNQRSSAVAMGYQAGQTTQGNQAVAIGTSAGNNLQRDGAVAIGYEAGKNTQSANGIAIGTGSGNEYQSSNAISIGATAGTTSQGSSSVAIGASAGQLSQSQYSIAIGEFAGSVTQGSSSVAIGESAGQTTQGISSIAIGYQAGQIVQGLGAVAIGFNSGLSNQGTGAVAIGQNASKAGQGSYSVAIGYGTGQTTVIPSKSIILNASGFTKSPISESSFTVFPIRDKIDGLGAVLSYDTGSSGEVYKQGLIYTYTGAVGISNTAPTKLFSIGNKTYITDSDLNTVVTTGNVSASSFLGSGLYLSNIAGASVAAAHGSGSSIPVITVDYDGRISSVSNTSITFTGTLQAVTDSGNTTSNTLQFTNAFTAFVTSANVGIGNTNPFNLLSIGTKSVFNETGSNTGLVTTGNVTANYYYGNSFYSRWTTSATPGTYGSGTDIPQIVIDDNGRITAVGIVTNTPSLTLDQVLTSALTANTSGKAISLTGATGLMTNGNVGIGNVSPSNLLCIGANIYFTDTGSNTLVTSGNISANVGYFKNIITSANVGVGNLNPLNLLSIGTKSVFNDTGSNTGLLTTGNVTANYYYGSALFMSNIAGTTVAATYGTGTQMPQIVVDSTGKITSITSTAVTATLAQATSYGNVTSNTLQFTNAFTAFVTSANVGIGNTNPLNLLSIGTKSVFNDTGSNTGLVTTGNVTANYYYGSALFMSNIAGTTVAATYGSPGSNMPQIVVDSTGKITSIQSKAVILTLDNVVGYGSSTSNIIRLSNTGGMSLTSTGNVGIGNTTPFNLLSIGTNSVFNETGSNTGLVTTGNVTANYYYGSALFMSNIAGTTVAATYGTGTQMPQIVVDSTGKITSITSTPVSATLDQVLGYGNSTAKIINVSNTVGICLTTTGNVGIGNVLPSNLLCLGANTYFTDTGSNILVTTGNIAANNYYGNASRMVSTTGASAAVYGNTYWSPQITVDSTGRITAIQNTQIQVRLSDVTSFGNTTSNTLQFTNAFTAFVTSANVGIGNTNPFNLLSIGTKSVFNDTGSNTGLVTTGNVTANYYYGSALFMSNIAGTTVAATYGSPGSNMPQIVVDSTGKITSIQSKAVILTLDNVVGYGSSTSNIIRLSNTGGMSLTSTGNVGIGNTTPFNLLSIGTNSVFNETGSNTGLVTTGNVTANYYYGNSFFSRWTTSATPGTYGSLAAIPSITVDANGRISTISQSSLSLTLQQVNDFGNTYSGVMQLTGTRNSLITTGNVAIGNAFGTSNTLTVGSNLWVSDTGSNVLFVNGNILATSIKTTGNVGIGNVVPSNLLCIGANTYFTDTGSNTLVTNGNISAGYYYGNAANLTSIVPSIAGSYGSQSQSVRITVDSVGRISLMENVSLSLTNQNLDQVLGIGNTSSNIMYLSNTTVGLIAVGNVVASRFNITSDSTKLGLLAGELGTNSYVVSLGYQAGQSGQYANAIAIGSLAGSVSQNSYSVSIGDLAGRIGQQVSAVAIGQRAGTSNQAVGSVAIGQNSGESKQGFYSVAIGNLSGTSSQGTFTVAVGNKTGNIQQSTGAVSVGDTAGESNQGSYAVAIGKTAGNYLQNINAIAIGTSAGFTSQGSGAIAIGAYAGYSGQFANSIVLNAAGPPLNGAAAGLYINPIRSLPTTAMALTGYTSGYEVGTSTLNQTASGDIYLPTADSFYGKIAGSNTITALSVSAPNIYGAIGTGATNTIAATSLTLSGAITGATSVGCTSVVSSGAISGTSLVGPLYGSVNGSNNITTTGIISGSKVTASTGFYGPLVGTSNTISGLSLTLAGAITGATSVGCTSVVSSGAISGTNLTLTGTALGALKVAASTGFYGPLLGTSNAISGLSLSVGTGTTPFTVASDGAVTAKNIWDTTAAGTSAVVMVNNVGQLTSPATTTLSITGTTVTCATLVPTSLTIPSSALSYASITGAGAITGISLNVDVPGLGTYASITSAGVVTGTSLNVSVPGVGTYASITSAGAITGTSLNVTQLTTDYMIGAIGTGSGNFTLNAANLRNLWILSAAVTITLPNLSSTYNGVMVNIRVTVGGAWYLLAGTGVTIRDADNTIATAGNTIGFGTSRNALIAFEDSTTTWYVLQYR